MNVKQLQLFLEQSIHLISSETLELPEGMGTSAAITGRETPWTIPSGELLGQWARGAEKLWLIMEVSHFNHQLLLY